MYSTMPEHVIEDTVPELVMSPKYFASAYGVRQFLKT